MNWSYHIFERQDSFSHQTRATIDWSLSFNLPLMKAQSQVVQSSISAKPGLTLKKIYTVNPGLPLIQLWTTGYCIGSSPGLFSGGGAVHYFQGGHYHVIIKFWEYLWKIYKKQGLQKGAHTPCAPPWFHPCHFM